MPHEEEPPFEADSEVVTIISFNLNSKILLKKNKLMGIPKNSPKTPCRRITIPRRKITFSQEMTYKPYPRFNQIYLCSMRPYIDIPIASEHHQYIQSKTFNWLEKK